MMEMNEAFAPLDEEVRTGAGSAGRSDDPWRPILPVPEGAPQLTTAIINRFAPEGFAFTAGWRYPDAEGRLLGCAVRYDRPANGKPADKQVKPFTFCEGSGGKREWRCKGDRHQLLHVPDVIREPGFHGGRDAERLMDAAVVVEHGVDRDHRGMALDLLGEAVGQASEPPHPHPHVEVLALDVAGADLRHIGLAEHRLLDDPVHSPGLYLRSGEVTPLGSPKSLMRRA